jgi:glutamine synthetase
MLPKLTNILARYNIKLLVGLELEFYCTDKTKLKEALCKNPSDIKRFNIMLKDKEKYFDFSHLKLKREIGEDQFEAIFPPTSELQESIADILKFQSLVSKCANFNAKPFPDKAPSALQFNLSLWKNDENILEDEETLNSILFSLTKFIPESMIFFTRNQNCFERITDIKSIIKFRNSPINISVGKSMNRTTALRVIDEKTDQYHYNNSIIKGTRIEHRVPSANCHVEASFYVIIAALIYGIKYPAQEKVPQIYENAFEVEEVKKYKFKPLPSSRKQSMEIYQNGLFKKIIKKLISY